MAAGIVLFTAGYVRGLTGFGLSAIVVVGLGLITDPVAIVPMAFVLEIAASLFHARSAMAEAPRRELGLLLLPAIPCGLFGLAILYAIDGDVLTAVILVGLLLTAAALASGVTPVLGGSGRGRFLLLGAVAGVVNGATGLGGLVLATTLAMAAGDAVTNRAMITMYLLLVNVPMIAVLLFSSSYGVAEPALLWFLPLAAVGLLSGARAARRHTGLRLQQASLSVVAALSLMRIVEMMANR